jgi:hypothetical protein
MTDKTDCVWKEVVLAKFKVLSWHFSSGTEEKPWDFFEQPQSKA